MWKAINSSHTVKTFHLMAFFVLFLILLIFIAAFVIKCVVSIVFYFLRWRISLNIRNQRVHMALDRFHTIDFKMETTHEIFGLNVYSVINLNMAFKLNLTKYILVSPNCRPFQHFWSNSTISQFNLMQLLTIDNEWTKLRISHIYFIYSISFVNTVFERFQTANPLRLQLLYWIDYFNQPQ